MLGDFSNKIYKNFKIAFCYMLNIFIYLRNNLWV